MHTAAKHRISHPAVDIKKRPHCCSRRTGAPTAAAAGRKQRASHLQQLSTILLVNENLRRRLGRGLVDQYQLQNALAVIEQAEYALLVVATHKSTYSIAQSDQLSAYPVLYANAAATSLLRFQQQEEQQQLCELQIPTELSAAVQQAWAPTEQPQQLQQQQQYQCTHLTIKDVLTRCADGSMVSLRSVLALPVYAPNDAYLGLAFVFDTWCYPADGSIGAPRYLRIRPSELPTPEALQKAADAVRQQADVVRDLKQGQGLSNKDPKVLAAVNDLQQLKQQLAWLEGLQATFQSSRQSIVDKLLQESMETAGETS